MTNREIKNFHSENRTHTVKKEFKGESIEITGAANAPMSFMIFGNSKQEAKYWQAEGGCRQIMTDQGKNLFNIDSFSTTSPYYTKDGDIITANRGQVGISFTSNIKTLKAGKYVLSAEVMFADEETDPSDPYGLLIMQAESVDGTNYYTFGGMVEGKKEEWVRVSHALNVTNDITGITFDIQPLGGNGKFFDLNMKIRNIQLEKGEVMTDYIKYGYPAEITSQISAGTYKMVFGGKTYTAVLPDLYGIGENTDKFIVDEVTLTARVKKVIDETLFDNTKAVAENTQVVREQPIYKNIALTEVSDSSADFVPWTAYGKNLFNIDSFSTTSPYYTKDGDIIIANRGQTGISFTSNIKSLKAGKYVLSAEVMFADEETDPSDPYGMLIMQAESVDGTNYYTFGGMVEGKKEEWVRVSHALNVTNDITGITFDIQPLGGNEKFFDLNMKIRNIQLEKGDIMIDYESFFAEPPESLVPSVTYPQKIIPAKCIIKCSNKKNIIQSDIPHVGYAVEVDDFNKSNITVDGKWYAADYIEYDQKENKVRRVKYIDDKLLDETRLLSNQKNAVLSKPEIQEIDVTEDEYNFAVLESLANTFKVEIADESVKPLEMLAEAYLICNSGSDERKITYDALNNFKYDKLYNKIPYGEEI